MRFLKDINQMTNIKTSLHGSSNSRTHTKEIKSVPWESLVAKGGKKKKKKKSILTQKMPRHKNLTHRKLTNTYQKD